MDSEPVTFLVVLTRGSALTADDFRRYFTTVHEPLALALPGLIGYVQHFAVDDPLRARPAWDAVIELRFASRDAMEAAWRSEAGVAATADLEQFADLERSSWGLVEDRVIRRAAGQ